MPEPDKAGASEPTDQMASTQQPAVADRTQTTTQPRGEGKSNETTDATTREMMDALGIPDEIRTQIAPVTEKKEPEKGREGDTEAEKSGEETAQDAEAEPEKSGEGEADDEADDDEREDVAATTEDEPPMSKAEAKLRKRIGRLTRQKSEAESKLDAAYAETERLRAQLEQTDKAGETADATAKPKTGTLAHVISEAQLDKEIANAEAWIDWCDSNAEGATTGEGENQKFIGPEDIAKLRRANEKVILLAPTRRQQIQKLDSERARFDTVSQQAWPEMFDPKSEEGQLKVTLEKAYPWLNDLPQRNYAIGLIIEGMKSLYQRTNAIKNETANGRNGEGTRKERAISEKAFTAPRVPIAPSRPDAPTREVVPSSQKKLNQAFTELAMGGGRESLVAALDALDEADGSRKPMSQRLVKT